MRVFPLLEADGWELIISGVLKKTRFVIPVLPVCINKPKILWHNDTLWHLMIHWSVGKVSHSRHFSPVWLRHLRLITAGGLACDGLRLTHCTCQSRLQCVSAAPARSKTTTTRWEGSSSHFASSSSHFAFSNSEFLKWINSSRVAYNLNQGESEATGFLVQRWDMRQL